MSVNIAACAWSGCKVTGCADMRKHVLTAAAFAQAHRTQHSTHRAKHIAPSATCASTAGACACSILDQHRDAASTMRMLADCGQGQPGICASTTLTCMELLQLPAQDCQ